MKLIELNDPFKMDAGDPNPTVLHIGNEWYIIFNAVGDDLPSNIENKHICNIVSYKFPWNFPWSLDSTLHYTNQPGLRIMRRKHHL